MSVSIATNPQPASWWQRLTGTEPKTVIRETSTTEVTSVAGGSFNLKTALRNGGIGAAVAGVLGGVSLLGKIALPIIGKVGSLGGLAKLAGVGGALGIATAAIPLIAPKVQESPAAKAALVGAGIGAAAGAILPLMPTWLGAAIGAGVGLLVHNRRNQPAPDYPTYPGFTAYPGYRPVGMAGDSAAMPGMVPVTPNYGAYVGSAVNPYGYGMPTAGYGYGYGSAVPTGYGMASPYGYGMTLPMQAGQGQQVVPQQAVPTPARPAAAAAKPAAAKPAAKPKFPGAKTWVDKQGNVRQLGTGTILKRPAGASRVAATSIAPTGLAPAAAAPVGAAAAGSQLSQLANPAAYLAAMQAAAAPQGTAATAANLAAAMNPAALQAGAMPAMPTAVRP